MADKTYLDEMIDYKQLIISSIAASPEIVGLLLNDPNVDMDSDEAYNIVGKHIFDFDYVDKTVQTSTAYILVDDEMVYPTSGSMNQWLIYVQVICAKEYVPLDHKKFKGMNGNRRDNLARYIDYLLNGRTDIGIGKLDLQSVSPATVPDTFTSLLLTYQVHEFRRERGDRR